MNRIRIKRVGIDARFVIDSDHPHGDLLRQLLKANKRDRHPCDYVLFHANQLKPVPAWLDCPNVFLIFLSAKNLNERWFYWSVFDPAVAAARLDLFISPFYRLPLRSWLCGIPMLHTIYDVAQLTLSPSLLPNRFRNPWKRLQIRIGFLVFSRLARRTITGSSHAATEISRTLGLPRSRIAVVPNCFDVDEIPADIERPNPKPYLLFIGTDMPKKNLAGLLRAWPLVRARFPDVNLLVRSSLTPEQKAECPEGVVVKDEYLARPVLQSLISQASALILPSFHEGFGIPVLEAMALGTPVCVSRGTALEEVAGEGALLFDPYSPSSIADTCCDALGLTHLQRKAECERGRRRAAQLSPSSVLPGLLNLILENSRS